MAARRQGLNVDQLKLFAKEAAAKTLKRLRAEVIAIERTFPDLAVSRRPGVGSSVAGSRRSRRMSAAARKAVSLRMRKYWAERRRAKKAA